MVSVVSADTFSQLRGNGASSSRGPGSSTYKPPVSGCNGKFDYNSNCSDDGPDVYYFKGKDEVLSNFYRTRLTIFNRKFGTSESAYQYCKAVFHEYPEVAEELVYASSGLAAKAISHKVPTRPEWHELKAEAMRVIIGAKMEQCLEFRRFHEGHPNTKLVENTENDYWAKGVNGQGQNMLGKILMEIRDEMLNNDDAKNLRAKRMEEFMSRMKWPEPRERKREGYSDKKDRERDGWRRERGDGNWRSGRGDGEKGGRSDRDGYAGKVDGSRRTENKDRYNNEGDWNWKKGGSGRRDDRHGERRKGGERMDNWNIKMTDDPKETQNAQAPSQHGIKQGTDWQDEGNKKDIQNEVNEDKTYDIDHWDYPQSSTCKGTGAAETANIRVVEKKTDVDLEKDDDSEDDGGGGLDDGDQESKPEKTDCVPGHILGAERGPTQTKQKDPGAQREKNRKKKQIRKQRKKRNAQSSS